MGTSHPQDLQAKKFTCCFFPPKKILSWLFPRILQKTVNSEYIINIRNNPMRKKVKQSSIWKRFSFEFVSLLVYIPSLKELECNLVKLVISFEEQSETKFHLKRFSFEFASPLVYIPSLKEFECNLVKLVISLEEQSETKFHLKRFSFEFASPLVYFQSLEELECNLVKLLISSGETTFCRRNSSQQVTNWGRHQQTFSSSSF